MKREETEVNWPRLKRYWKERERRAEDELQEIVAKTFKVKRIKEN